MGTWVHPGYSATTCLRVRVLRHELSAGTGTGALAVPGFRVRLRVQEGLAELRVVARPRLGGGVLITSDTRFVTDITFFVFLLRFLLLLWIFRKLNALGGHLAAQVQCWTATGGSTVAHERTLVPPAGAADPARQFGTSAGVPTGCSEPSCGHS